MFFRDIRMICRKCNHEYPDEMETCPICGEPRPDIAGTEPQDAAGGDAGTTNAYGAGPAAGPRPPQNTQWVGSNPSHSSVPAVQRSDEAKGGVAPLVLGILSLMIPYVGIVLGILAIVFGNGAKKTNAPGSANYTLGQAGWVLGIIGLVFQAFLIIYLAFAFSMIFSLIDEMTAYGRYSGYNPFF